MEVENRPEIVEVEAGSRDNVYEGYVYDNWTLFNCAQSKSNTLWRSLFCILFFVYSPITLQTNRHCNQFLCQEAAKAREFVVMQFAFLETLIALTTDYFTTLPNRQKRSTGWVQWNTYIKEFPFVDLALGIRGKGELKRERSRYQKETREKQEVKPYEKRGLGKTYLNLQILTHENTFNTSIAFNKYIHN